MVLQQIIKTLFGILRVHVAQVEEAVGGAAEAFHPGKVYPVESRIVDGVPVLPGLGQAGGVIGLPAQVIVEDGVVGGQEGQDTDVILGRQFDEAVEIGQTSGFQLLETTVDPVPDLQCVRVDNEASVRVVGPHPGSGFEGEAPGGLCADKLVEQRFGGGLQADGQRLQFAESFIGQAQLVDPVAGQLRDPLALTVEGQAVVEEHHVETQHDQLDGALVVIEEEAQVEVDILGPGQVVAEVVGLEPQLVDGLDGHNHHPAGAQQIGVVVEIGFVQQVVDLGGAVVIEPGVDPLRPRLEVDGVDEEAEHRQGGQRKDEEQESQDEASHRSARSSL